MVNEKHAPHHRLWPEWTVQSKSGLVWQGWQGQPKGSILRPKFQLKRIATCDTTDGPQYFKNHRLIIQAQEVPPKMKKKNLCEVQGMASSLPPPRNSSIHFGHWSQKLSCQSNTMVYLYFSNHETGICFASSFMSQYWKLINNLQILLSCTISSQQQLTPVSIAREVLTPPFQVREVLTWWPVNWATEVLTPAFLREVLSPVNTVRAVLTLVFLVKKCWLWPSRKRTTDEEQTQLFLVREMFTPVFLKEELAPVYLMTEVLIPVYLATVVLIEST